MLHFFFTGLKHGDTLTVGHITQSGLRCKTRSLKHRSLTEILQLVSLPTSPEQTRLLISTSKSLYVSDVGLIWVYLREAWAKRLLNACVSLSVRGHTHTHYRLRGLWGKRLGSISMPTQTPHLLHSLFSSNSCLHGNRSLHFSPSLSHRENYVAKDQHRSAGQLCFI